jgi:hypothetical protein
MFCLINNLFKTIWNLFFQNYRRSPGPGKTRPQKLTENALVIGIVPARMTDLFYEDGYSSEI